jgi:RNase P/RNase MRP subunit p29
VRGLNVRVLPGPERNRISIEGRIVANSYRTLNETDGLYIWDNQFGFWVEREALAALHKVNWVTHYAG